jgi:magnesium transporter
MSQVTVRWLDSAGHDVQVGTLEDIDRASAGGAPWVWVDITGADEHTMGVLAQRFDFHVLSVEDSQHEQHRAKVDRYPDGLFLVWLTPEHLHGDGVSASEIDVFVGARYLVTSHAKSNPAVDAVASDATRIMAQGPAWVLHKIVDLLVDSTLPLIDRVGEQLSSIEDRMLDDPRQDDLRELHRVRRQLVRLHRIIAPERDVLRGLARDSDIVSEEAYRYFQDIGDHVARALDSLETYQDVGSSVMDVYLSAQSNRLNEIMKQLTVVATIFMPLTLLSGIYGMNLVRGMWPPIEAFWSFHVVILVMLVIASVMATYFRRKNWW